MKNTFLYKNNNLFLVYQPQYIVNKIVGVEVLLRDLGHTESFPKIWYNSLSQNEIIDLDLIIVEKALFDLKEFGFNGSISINVNIDFFTEDNLFKLLHLLQLYEINSNKIILEVLEKDLILESDINILTKFVNKNIRLAIDDIPIDFSVSNLLVFKRHFGPSDFICKINTNYKFVSLSFIYNLLDLGYILVLEQADPKDFPNNIVKRVQFQSFELSRPIPIDRLLTI